jgi:endogenous inhibitor of DNA gyrase (YacG/DUF329 family)
MADDTPKGKCPICAEPTDAHYRPFCSRRCADIDLHRWLSGGYAIGGRDDDDDAGAGQGPATPADEPPDDDFRSSD